MKNPQWIQCVETGKILIQVEDSSQFGFSLLDSDQAYTGGFGSGVSDWDVIDAKDVPKAIYTELSWIFEECDG